MQQHRYTFSLKLLLCLVALQFKVISQVNYPSDSTFISTLSNSAKDNLQSFKNAHINIPPSDLISNLKTFGEYPVNPGASGKKDIFAPF